MDISKAPGKVWHEGLLYKLQTYGVKGEVLPKALPKSCP